MDLPLQYPIAQIKDFSELLVVFERALNSVLQGETSLAMQLRDVPVFKRIKQKIENLPYLKELFFPKNSKSAVVVRRIGRANASEMPGLTREVKIKKNVMSSVDLSMPVSVREKPQGAGSGFRLLPPIKHLETSAFSTDDEPAVALADVQTALASAIEETDKQMGMVRKLKLALFHSPAHASSSAHCLYKYLMFVLFGSSEPKLILRSRGRTKLDPGTRSSASPRRRESLPERRPPRPVSRSSESARRRAPWIQLRVQPDADRNRQQGRRE